MSDPRLPLLGAHRPADVGDDFEARVFAKIGRVKRRRRVAAAVSAPLALLALVAAMQFLAAPRQAPQPLVASAGAPAAKEEVPVSADVYFSPYSGRTQYPVERVSYTRATTPAASRGSGRQEL